MVSNMCWSRQETVCTHSRSTSRCSKRSADERDLPEPQRFRAAVVLYGNVPRVWPRSALGLVLSMLGRHGGDAIIVGYQFAVELDGCPRAAHRDLQSVPLARLPI